MITSEQRLCSRINLTRAVKLTLEDGEVINATTDDISLGGIKAFTIHDIADYSGQQAQLQLMLHENQYSRIFNCHIVSCENKLLRLKLERKQANAFSMLVSKGALKQVKRQLSQ